jgi:tetratricopeptide (TPR) repeat protein
MKLISVAVGALLATFPLCAAPACLDQGQALERQGKYREALKTYEASAAAEPDCAVEAGKLHYNQGKNPRVFLRLTTQALEREPYHAAAHYNMGVYHWHDLNNTRKARYHFAFAALLGDGDALAMLDDPVLKSVDAHPYFLADTVEQAGFEYREIAKRFYRFAVQKPQILSPDNPVVYEEPGFRLTFGPQALQVEATLNAANAQRFGNAMRRLEHALYGDIPLRVETEGDALLSVATVAGGGEWSFVFERFKHRFVFEPQSQRAVYAIEIQPKATQ